MAAPHDMQHCRNTKVFQVQHVYTHTHRDTQSPSQSQSHALDVQHCGDAFTEELERNESARSRLIQEKEAEAEFEREMERKHASMLERMEEQGSQAGSIRSSVSSQVMVAVGYMYDTSRHEWENVGGDGGDDGDDDDDVSMG
eukprot:1159406-Pelagomonas_calceolata.AAC.1